MRQILFRGKRLDNGEWIYGDLIHIDKSDIGIVTDYAHWQGCRVNPKTVGQFTGLFDRNGKEIYEGDIVNRIEEKSDYYPEQPGICREHPETRRWEEIHTYTITYDVCPRLDGRELLCRQLDGSKVEVIGNIHDTPDLLNGK